LRERNGIQTQKQSLCADIHPDDDIDPKDFFRESRRRKNNDRKARQLCAQVAETLSLVLSGECSDEVLNGLEILSVMPAPDTSQLLVVVGPAIGNESLDAEQVHMHLARVSSRLRAEVAAAITRRRTPRFLFRYVHRRLGGEMEQ
jgi:ribosome-binding factor A